MGDYTRPLLSTAVKRGERITACSYTYPSGGGEAARSQQHRKEESLH